MRKKLLALLPALLLISSVSFAEPAKEEHKADAPKIQANSAVQETAAPSNDAELKKAQEQKVLEEIASRKQVSLTEERLIKLERSLDSLQKGLNNTPTSSSGTVDSQSIAKMNASNYAQFQDLKDQIKEMRGEVEQMQFDLARLNEKFIKFSNDIEFRFSEMEKAKTQQSSDQKILSEIDKNLDNETIKQTGDGANKKAEDSKKGDAKTVEDKVVKKRNMEQDYQDAYSFLKEKDYKRAREAFKKFIDNYPDSELTGSAYYWAGETFFLRADFEKAAIEYLKGYQADIRGSRAADNLLKLAKSLGKMEKRKEACTTYIKLTKEFPNASNSIKKEAKEDMKTYRCSAN